jgi:hypothetical protein
MFHKKLCFTLLLLGLLLSANFLVFGDGLMFKVAVLPFSGNVFMKTNLGQALRMAVSSAVEQLDEKISEGGTIKGLVVYADSSRIIIDAGSNLGVQKGMTFEVQHVVQEIRHPKTGELLDEIVETVAEIIVTDVKEKSATCAIVSQNGTGIIASLDKVVLKVFGTAGCLIRFALLLLCLLPSVLFNCVAGAGKKISWQKFVQANLPFKLDTDFFL